MRKALNDNPVVQIGALAALALLVGFLLITRMSHKGSESATATTATDSSVASTAPTASPSDTSSTATSSAAPDATAAPAPTVPSASAGAVAPTGGFVAGPGLPASVVHAYRANEVVVLLVVRRNGIDDEAVKAGAEAIGGPSKVALFVTNAGHIARYSRIAAGVSVDRVPALIVLRPRKLTDGGIPEATVSYGFRGVESVAQAVRDATYKGPTDLPYYPK
jgi:hypothetical protein